MSRELPPLETIHPDLREGAAKTPTVDFGNPFLFPLLKYVAFPLRDFKGRYRGDDVTLSVVRAGCVSLRLYTPKEKTGNGALLWMHGGGLIVGHPRRDDRLCAELAKASGAIVVSVRYRLAPRHLFPAGFNDCVAAWQWLLTNAERLGVDPLKIAIGGQSAGGGLAAALCQKLLDDGGVQPVAQCLLYPMLDDHTAADHTLDGKFLIWCNESNRFGWKAYLGQAPGAEQTPPYAVPARRTDLHRLPPAWIGVGTRDLFEAEDRAYAQALRAADVPVHLEILEGAPHGFVGFGADASITKGFVASMTSFLAGKLA